MIPNLPSIKLSTGLVVANYSSPHTFEFEDGSVLGACSKERCVLTMLEGIETIHERHLKYNDIRLLYNMTWFLEEEFKEILEKHIHNDLPWNILITPLPIMQAWKKYRSRDYTPSIGPWRTGRMVDRYNKLLSISKFCIS